MQDLQVQELLPQERLEVVEQLAVVEHLVEHLALVEEEQEGAETAATSQGQLSELYPKLLSEPQREGLLLMHDWGFVAQQQNVEVAALAVVVAAEAVAVAGLLRLSVWVSRGRSSHLPLTLFD